MENMDELIKIIEKAGLTVEQFDASLEDCFNKLDGLNNLEWQDIVDKYGIKLNHDTIRKGMTSPYGAKFVTQYLKLKEEIKGRDATGLEEVKQIVGEQFLLKKQLQKEKSQINKFKTEFVKCISVAEEIINALREEGMSITIPECCKEPITVEDSEKSMVVIISDWHIGYVIKDCKGNQYNYEIANTRIDKLISSCGKYIELYGINKVYVFNLGDTVEHTYMRDNQSQACEFYQNEQVAKATRLIFRFITAISEMNCNVVYDSISGNHDRACGDKGKSLVGDNVNATITPVLKEYVTISDNKRITIVDRNYADTEIVTTINGVKFKMVHGDKNSKVDTLKNELSMSKDAEDLFDVFVTGHWHNFKCVAENRGRYYISNGCLSGFNDYSTTFGCATEAEQTIIVIGNKEIEMVKDVNLA